jgi:hypothetical protein
MDKHVKIKPRVLEEILAVDAEARSLTEDLIRTAD